LTKIKMLISLLILMQSIVANYAENYIECGISHYLPAALYTSVGYPPSYTNAMASPYSMPWNVIIEAEHKICGGVLIRLEKITNSSNTVLSSSSCFFEKFGMAPNHANTKVHLGVHKFPSDTNTVTVGIKHVTSTPYEQEMMKKDIALITLQADVEFNEKIRPICLPSINFKPPVAHKYPLVGWTLSENIPCGTAIVRGPKIQPSVGYPPNFKNVMAMPYSMPWNVIVEAEIATCGGVLIRFNQKSNYTDTVLTSSRCFYKNYKVDHANVKVHLGVHKLPLSRDTVTSGVKCVTTTPLTKTEKQKDLALITLEGGVEISEKIRPICLPSKDLEITTPAVLWLVGWHTKDGYGLPSGKDSFLMQLPVLIITPTNCKKLYTSYSKNNHICGRYVDPILFNITQNVDYGSPLIGQNAGELYVLGTFNGHTLNLNGTGNHKCGVGKFPQRRVYYYFTPNETNAQEHVKEHIQALPHSFPWSALIRGRKRICGGALVAIPHSYSFAEYVLTTAQCFLDKNDK
ncbi:Prostasin, partial [Trichinella pseudospiralis]